MDGFAAVHFVTHPAKGADNCAARLRPGAVSQSLGSQPSALNPQLIPPLRPARKMVLIKSVLMTSRLLPTAVQKIGEELAIAWSDGTESFIPLEFLRRGCPCAACGGEPDVLGNVLRPEVEYSPSSFELRGWQVVGGYAVQPFWADGHGSGLYTFPLLQRLGLAAQSAGTPSV